MLYQTFVQDCRRLAKILTEKNKLHDGYNRYLSLLREEVGVRANLYNLHGVLGKHSPMGLSVSLSDAESLSLRFPNSDVVREKMKTWEMLKVYLSAEPDGATVSDFQGFLNYLEIDKTPQAIESAISAHSELFKEKKGTTRRVVSLRVS
jgi:hypothetical protein